MNYNELLEEAKKGNDISLCVPTFSKSDEYEKILKPYGYKLTDISTYNGRTTNVTFKSKIIPT